MDMDTSCSAVCQSQNTALVIDNKAVVVRATHPTKGDTQDTSLLIDEDKMLPEVQITILVEDIMVVNNVKQHTEHPVSLNIPINAGNQNHIPISPVSGLWAEAYPGFDLNVIPANWDSFDLDDTHPPA
jgi:hypothetical protein